MTMHNHVIFGHTPLILTCTVMDESKFFTHTRYILCYDVHIVEDVIEVTSEDVGRIIGK